MVADMPTPNYSRYNLYRMAADPLCGAQLRAQASARLELGDEDEYVLLKKLADKVDEVAKRYEPSQLMRLADEYDQRNARPQATQPAFDEPQEQKRGGFFGLFRKKR